MTNTYTCKCCKNEYTKTKCDFHNLCDMCFNQFDSQKMKGRFNFTGKPVFYFEHPSDFIEANICIHEIQVPI